MLWDALAWVRLGELKYSVEFERVLNHKTVLVYV